MRSTISCGIPWARNRLQIASLSTESKAALGSTFAIQSGWRYSIIVCTMQFSVNMRPIVDLPGVKPLCCLGLRLSSCRCAFALDRRMPEKTLTGTDRGVIPRWFLHSRRLPFPLKKGMMIHLAQSAGMTLEHQTSRTTRVSHPMPDSPPALRSSAEMRQIPAAFPLFSLLVSAPPPSLSVVGSPPKVGGDPVGGADPRPAEVSECIL